MFAAWDDQGEACRTLLAYRELVVVDAHAFQDRRCRDAHAVLVHRSTVSAQTSTALFSVADRRMSGAQSCGAQDR